MNLPSKTLLSGDVIFTNQKYILKTVQRVADVQARLGEAVF